MMSIVTCAASYQANHQRIPKLPLVLGPIKSVRGTSEENALLCAQNDNMRRTNDTSCPLFFYNCLANALYMEANPKASDSALACVEERNGDAR
jgi:hypothetical protein